MNLIVGITCIITISIFSYLWVNKKADRILNDINETIKINEKITKDIKQIKNE